MKLKSKTVRILTIALGLFACGLLGHPSNAHANARAFLDPTNVATGGADRNNATPIPTGAWLEFDFGYNGNPAAGIPGVASFVNIDTNFENVDSVQFNSDAACLNHPNNDNNTYFAPDYANCNTSDIQVLQDRGDNVDKGGHCIKTDYSNNSQPCLTEGFHVAMQHNGTPNGRSYSIRIKLSPRMKAGANICMSATVSRWPASVAAFVGPRWPYWDFIDNAPIQCWKVATQAVSGGVESTLGKQFSGNDDYGNPIRITDPCFLAGTLNWNVTNGVFVSDADEDANPHYAKGANMCLRAPGSIRFENTSYDLRTPVYTPPNRAGENSYEHQVAGIKCGSNGALEVLAAACNNNIGYWPYNKDLNIAYDRSNAQDSSYDFTYIPRPELPALTKSTSTPGDKQPGAAVSYSITAENDHDVFLPNFVFEDAIPLNMKPDRATITLSAKLTINYGGFRDGFPSEDEDLNCTTFDQSEHQMTLLAGANNQFSYKCFIADSAIGGGMPRVYIWFENFPYRGKLDVNWSGQVKDRDNIGVYAQGYNANTWNNSGLVAGCASDTSCLQGVINVARATYDLGVPGWANSNQVYNPIPGKLNCIGKTTDAKLDRTGVPNPLAVTATSCGAVQPTAGLKWVYDPDRPDYKSANFTIFVEPNTDSAKGGTGPVDFTVYDQDTGALDSAVASTTSSDGATPTGAGNAQLSWPTVRSTVGPTSFGFNAVFQDKGIGHQLYNTVKACYPNTWTSPRPAAPICVVSDRIVIEQVDVTNPYVTSENGDVHVGGGVAANGTCSTTTAKSRQANPNSAADYFVTASGAIDKYFSSAINAAAKTYGAICRPNVKEATENARAKASANFSDLTAASQGTYDGKVVDVGGPGLDTHLPAFNVHGRWTLHVKGDLYIDGDIKPDAIVLNGSPEAFHPSFGVVVDGNMYIKNSVTQLDGFYFVNDLINTCAEKSPAFKTLNSGYNVSNCSNQLTVNGLMMANRFRLNRTNLGSSGNTARNSKSDSAEFITLTNNLYTATPPGFSDVSKTYSAPRNLGESRPRY